jgi:hypothetical protein
VSPRNYTIASVALIMLGAGGWWVLSSRSSQDNAAPAGPSSSRNSTEEVSRASTAPPAPVVVDSNSSNSHAEEPPRGAATLPSAAVWPEHILKFAAREDTDPTLSKEIEYWIQQSINSIPESGSYDIQSIKCRAYNCQILSVNRASAAGNGWAPVLSKVLQKLDASSIRNPSTGVQLGQPMLESIEQIRGEPPGVVTVIAYEKP